MYQYYSRTEPENLGQDFEIASYQVIVENSDIHLIVDLASKDRALTVPPELLKKNTLYIFEVLAKEDSGNPIAYYSFSFH